MNNVSFNPVKSDNQLSFNGVENSLYSNLSEKIEELRFQLINPIEDKEIQGLESEIESIMQKLGADGILRQFFKTSDQDERCGTKHKNLILLLTLVNVLGIPDIEVPIPHGFSTDLIEAFLKKHAPEVFLHWSGLGQLYAAHLSMPEKKSSSEEKSIPFLETPEAAVHLNAVNHAIITLFNKASNDPSSYETLGISTEIDKWLQTCHEEGNFLMTRSSGAEDTAQVANAGGNLSVAYVLPVKEIVCQSMGRIVSSYFS
ncbi:MAG: hypothetical protein H0T62_08525 [Parachlamydiaceae bacterium]|nr:hypothetical protein [Parachlamydiaceae bacterium]